MAGINIKNIPNATSLSTEDYVIVEQTTGTKKTSINDLTKTGTVVHYSENPDTIVLQKPDMIEKVNNIQDDITKVSSQLEQKANYNEVIKKGQVDLDEMTERTLQAIQGGGEGTNFNLLSVPRDASVTPVKLSDDILKEVANNLIDKLFFEQHPDGYKMTKFEVQNTFSIYLKDNNFQFSWTKYKDYNYTIPESYSEWLSTDVLNLEKGYYDIKLKKNNSSNFIETPSQVLFIIDNSEKNIDLSDISCGNYFSTKKIVMGQYPNFDQKDIMTFNDFFSFENEVIIKIQNNSYKVAWDKFESPTSSNPIEYSNWLTSDFKLEKGIYRFKFANLSQTELTESDLIKGKEIIYLEYKLNNYLDNKLISILDNKKVNVIGDSYVANHVQSIELTWHKKVADKHNMIYRNYGINGCPLVAEGREVNGEILVPVKNRISEMDNDADYVIVIGGENDRNEQIAISDFKDGLRFICNQLIIKYPGAKICFFTPWNQSYSQFAITIKEYVDAMIEVCGDFSIPIFDSYRLSNIYMFNQEFRKKYSQSETDESHLNSLGHDLFFNKGENFLEML